MNALVEHNTPGFPFFTIITATRNAAPALPRLLESLASQTCRDFELIIQDGASTDDTLAIAETWRDRLPCLSLAREADSGIYDAWNKALPRIRGQWTIFLGADDCLANSHALGLCKDILKNSSPATYFAVGGVDLCDSNGCVVMTMPGKADGVSSHLPKGNAPFWQNGLFHSRSLFEKNSFDASFKIFGDYEFICRTWSDESAIHLPVIVALVTLGGISNNPARLMKGRMEIMRILRRYFGIRPLPGFVFKACAAWVIYSILGSVRGMKFVNRLKKALGLPMNMEIR
jgi:glycosyltransferase involved in cell wall biosynthesis